MEYKIHQKADDIKDIVIEKTGHKIHFTMREVESVQKQNKAQKENIEAKMRVEKAKMDNIERNHKFVTEMSEQDLHTAWMYLESKNFVQIAKEKLEEFEKNEKEMEKEIIDIRKQIPEFAGKVVNLSDLEETNEAKN